MTYGLDQTSDYGNGMVAALPQATSGNYTINPQSGLFEASNRPMPQAADSSGELNKTVRALMRGYLRKQQGGYIPLTSAAPPNIMGPLSALDRYRTFGVPYTGYQYGQKQPDSYDAMFGSGY